MTEGDIMCRGWQRLRRSSPFVTKVDLPLGTCENRTIEMRMGHQQVDGVGTETCRQQFDDPAHLLGVALMSKRVVRREHQGADQVGSLRKTEWQR